MSPAATASSRAAQRAQDHLRPERRWSPSAEPPAPLSVVDHPHRSPAGRRSKAPVIAVLLVVGSLLGVVIGQAALAGGQIRLTGLQARLAAEESTHRKMELVTARLEAPSRVVAEAERSQHLVQPGQITQLPSVPLNVPLPTPRMYAAPTAPAPVATTPVTTTPAATTPAGTSAPTPVPSTR